MTDNNSGRPTSGVHTVDDPQLATVLTDPVARQYYRPFVARARSVKEAAEEVGCALDTMLYRVRVFVKVGLLKVVEQRPRHGRAVKYYRTIFDEYFVPHAVTPFSTLEERLYATFEPYMREWARSVAREAVSVGAEGMRLYRDVDGQVWTKGAADESGLRSLDAPALRPRWDLAATLYLSTPEVREVQAALTRLLDAVRTKTVPGDEAPYNLAVFFHPQDR